MTSQLSDRDISLVETLWCPKDVAEFLNVSQATLSRWRREKAGPPFVQVGRVYRYNPVTVRAWVREQETARG
ncbi:helix-turn-helix domain-containing protein [Rhodococcus sp. (in: high G+C Gram-positive bacteria)]|uniref:helix-turn-helix domain-containing protein n=1 Tax=Rhodococcus sp. TaxID=1831 RepID=UPI002585D3C7|nr:helix-turn-helix domain-containing protein [Rhodococcus sp. (in: high G+C Gram-positive bacteria)]